MARTPEQIQKARELRRAITPAEKLLWQHLRDRRFAAFKFRRQHPVGPYVTDFYCAALTLVIELDGESHLENQERDQKRTAYLESQGMHMLRFWNTEVFHETEAVLESIYQECCRLCPEYGVPAAQEMQ